MLRHTHPLVESDHHGRMQKVGLDKVNSRHQLQAGRPHIQLGSGRRMVDDRHLRAGSARLDATRGLLGLTVGTSSSQQQPPGAWRVRW